MSPDTRVTAGAWSTSVCAMSTKMRFRSNARLAVRPDNVDEMRRRGMERLYTCCAGLDVQLKALGYEVTLTPKEPAA
jgi:hypothetical protein